MKPPDYMLPLIDFWSSRGMVFRAADADQNDLVTGQTSFADTTPTFLLSVPSGTVCVPLLVDISQTGSVAGGAVDYIIEVDDIDAYASGGTSETVLCTRTDKGNTYQTHRNCRLFTGATATAGYGVRVAAGTVGQDVSPAEGALNKIHWEPYAGLDFLVGPASLKVFTYAGTTGPTWFWQFKWAEWTTGKGVI